MIVRSEIIYNSLQTSGNRDIVEKHTDHANKEHFFTYSVPDGTNLNDRLRERIPKIEEDIKQTEIQEAVRNIEKGRNKILYWSTWSEVKLFLINRESEKDQDIVNITREKNNITDKINEIGKK